MGSFNFVASNLLVNNNGILKIADFGLARDYDSARLTYTPGTVTRWYRAPEILLGSDKYTTAVDIWSAGCILGELLKCKPLFCGESDLQQINHIVQICGTPTEDTMPGLTLLPDYGKVNLAQHDRKIYETFNG